jgi:UDP-2-acetamido-3-amino-2,3-dideoxy-glucuronate N-acetyltransferase
MVFTNVINPRSHIERKDEYKTTLVKQGASIGANATIVCGNTLGRYCFIGAGAVVTRDVPDYALIVGSPGKVRGYVCYCGDKLDIKPGDGDVARSSCGSCGKHYSKQNGIVTEIKG